MGNSGNCGVKKDNERLRFGDLVALHTRLHQLTTMILVNILVKESL